MATEENTTPDQPERGRISFKAEDVDNATLRITCAKAILATISMYQRGLKPVDEVLSDALYGVDLLLEDSLSKL